MVHCRCFGSLCEDFGREIQKQVAADSVRRSQWEGCGWSRYAGILQVQVLDINFEDLLVIHDNTGFYILLLWKFDSNWLSAEYEEFVFVDSCGLCILFCCLQLCLVKLKVCEVAFTNSQKILPKEYACVIICAAPHGVYCHHYHQPMFHFLFIYLLFPFYFMLWIYLRCGFIHI